MAKCRDGAHREPLIASQTGGRYVSLSSENDLETVVEALKTELGGDDSDGDGLDDCTERNGATDSVTGATFTSDPFSPDTDGDGLSDGEEVGEGFDLGDVSYSVLGIRIDLGDYFGDQVWVHEVRSDPRLLDTDFDTMDDLQEAAFESSARSADGDSDGLIDDEEQSLGTSPSSPDTDGDSFEDAVEEHLASEGFDPVVPTETQSKFSYIADFTIGATCGDFQFLLIRCERDSIAWLLGNLSSGVLLYGDIRDAISSLLRADVVGIGASLAGLVPFAGDGGSVIRKALRFAERHPDKADEALASLSRLEAVPLGAKRRLLRQLDTARYDRLRGAGMSDETIVRFAQSRVSFRVLDDFLRTPPAAGIIDTPPVGFLRRWQDGEEYLRRNYGGRAEKLDLPDGSGARIVDAWDPVEEVARESKVGYQSLNARTRSEIDKDVRLKQQRVARKVEWHFFASDASGKFGPTQPLLDTLRESGIPYYIHPPAG